MQGVKNCFAGNLAQSLFKMEHINHILKIECKGLSEAATAVAAAVTSGGCGEGCSHDHGQEGHDHGH